jgi:Gpi18-like mannosyltransferase
MMASPRRFFSLGRNASPSLLDYKNTKVLPFVYLSAVMIIICGLFMHVQVILRFVVALPFGYWYLASIYTDHNYRSMSKFFYYYFFLYGILGSVLFGVFLPPA